MIYTRLTSVLIFNLPIIALSWPADVYFSDSRLIIKDTEKANGIYLFQNQATNFNCQVIKCNYDTPNFTKQKQLNFHYQIEIRVFLHANIIQYHVFKVSFA